MPLKNTSARFGTVSRALHRTVFALPVTGLPFVMLGGYGVRPFGALALPNPLGERVGWDALARVVHVVLAHVALVVIARHVGLGIRKHVFERTGLMNRMLPFRDRAPFRSRPRRPTPPLSDPFTEREP